MKRSSKGMWPIVLFILLCALVGGVWLYSKSVIVDQGVAVSPQIEADGVNVIIVNNPYKATNYSSIVSAVRNGVSSAGTNISIVVVTGEYDLEGKSHIDDLFAGLVKLGTAGVYSYSTNEEDYEHDGVVNLHGDTDIVDLQDGSCSAAVDFQVRTGILTTTKKPNIDADETLQIWDIDEYSRRDVELSDAAVKILVGTKDASRIGCDAFILVGEKFGEGGDATMNVISGVAGEGASFNFETSQSRVVVHCGTSGALKTDNYFTRHSVGCVEIAGLDLDKDASSDKDNNTSSADEEEDEE